jgi:putative hydrolase of the HAD superfamily
MRLKLKGVFFDAGNTLLRVYPSLGVIYSEVAATFGANLPPELIEASFRDLWTKKDSLVSNEGHRNTYEKERDWWKYLVAQVFKDQIGLSDFDRFFDHLYARFALSDSWRVYDDVLMVLQTLKKRRLKLAIISNWDSRLPALCDQLELKSYFDTIVVSSIVGYEKPHPGIFEVALRETKLSPEEVLYIGDDPYLDYQGAMKAGLHAFQLDRYDRFPDHPKRLRNLNELLELLESET